MGYKIGTRNHPDVGKRVEIPPASDLWMRGARFGTVERVVDRSSSLVGAVKHNGSKVVASTMTPERAVIWRVRLDHPQARRRLYGFYASQCRLEYQEARAPYYQPDERY